MCAEPSVAVGSRSLPLDELMTVIEECMGRVSEQALSWTDNAKIENPTTSSPIEISALLPMVSDIRSFHLAVSATGPNSDLITRALLLIEEDEELPSDFDPGDAICEVVNIVAGDAKRALHDRDDSLKLGLPVVLKGTATFSCAEGQEIAVSEYKVGPASVQLTILYGFAKQ